MKELTFNQWQAHLSKELEKNYRKLKLIKNEKKEIKTLNSQNKVQYSN
jgi:hypothetical protein